MSDEKQAYTITDRATYLAMKDSLELEIVCEKDTDMLNPYGVITVNPEKNDQINAEGAKACRRIRYAVVHSRCQISCIRSFMEIKSGCFARSARFLLRYPIAAAFA